MLTSSLSTNGLPCKGVKNNLISSIDKTVVAIAGINKPSFTSRGSMLKNFKFKITF